MDKATALLQKVTNHLLPDLRSQETNMGIILTVIAFLILLLYALVCGYWTLFFQIGIAGIGIGIIYALGRWFWGWAWPLAGQLEDRGNWWEENRRQAINLALIALAMILAGVVVWVLVTKIPVPSCGISGSECGDISTYVVTRGNRVEISIPEYVSLDWWADTTVVSTELTRRGPLLIRSFTLKKGVTEPSTVSGRLYRGR